MSFEGEFSEFQSKLGALWRAKRSISTEALKARGIQIEKDLLKEYHERKKKHDAMKNKEGGIMGELVLLEGCDEEGLMKKSKPFKWFGDFVWAYEPNDVDDVMHGADALLFFTDNEDERRATPATVDVKTNPRDTDERLEQMFLHHAAKREAAPKKVYWADVMSEPGSASFDEPPPGVVESLPLVLYIPPHLVEEVRNDKTAPARREEIIRRLGPFIRHQAERQLSAMAAIASERLQLKDVQSRIPLADQLSKDRIASILSGSSPKEDGRRRLMDMIRNVLPAIWRTQEEKGDGPTAFLKSDLPALIQSIG